MMRDLVLLKEYIKFWTIVAIFIEVDKITSNITMIVNNFIFLISKLLNPKIFQSTFQNRAQFIYPSS